MARPISLVYYFATDGVGEINPTVSGSNHLRSLQGYDSELGGYKLSFSSSGSSSLVYNHMISYAPGYEHIQTVMKYGLEIKQNSKGM